MIAKGKVQIGLSTRFGADWPGQRCGAKTHRGTACQRCQQTKRLLSRYVMTQADLASADIPPPEFLIAKWLPTDSYGIVFADRGVGKSWFCMALAVAIAEGRQRFLSWSLNGQHSVLYVDGEMTTADLKERFSTLCRRKVAKVDGVWS